MVSIAILGLLALVNLAAALRYPPLLVNVAALSFLTMFVWRLLREQQS